MERKQMKKAALLGAALIFIPGSGIVYGAYLIYRASKKDPISLKEFIHEMKEEAKRDLKNEKPDA
jgi:hypothetical protein